MINKNILIVEDDLIAGEYLTELLVDSGFNVYPVIDNAKEALAFIKDKKPDLILMDIMIKGNISGCELSMMVRSFNKAVLIIFLTAYSEEEMIAYALNAKAYSYLLKPYRDIELFSKLVGLESETRKEDGCIAYQVMRKIDNEYATGVHKGIIVNEVWKNAESFNKHNDAEHITSFFETECVDADGSAQSWNVNLFK